MITIKNKRIRGNRVVIVEAPQFLPIKKMDKKSLITVSGGTGGALFAIPSIIDQ